MNTVDNQVDILLMKMPNHNIDYPSLAIPTLIGAIRNSGLSGMQRDINMEIRDYLITEKNLSEITYDLLPEICSTLYDAPKEYMKVKNMVDYLIFVDQNIGFSTIEKVKNKMQQREYKAIFCNEENSNIALTLFIVSSILHNAIDLAIINDELEIHTHSDNPIIKFLENVLEEVLELNPRVVGFSVLGIQKKATLWLAKRLKERFSGKIIIGGPDSSTFGETYIKNYPYFDVAFLKEGELNLVEFLNGKNLSSIDGVIYRNETDDIIVQKPKHRMDESYFTPDFDGLKLDKYLLPALPISASRGCKWAKCKFCVHHQTYSGYYHRKANDVVNDIEFLSNKYNINYFHFTDDMLELDLGNEITAEINRRNLDVSILSYVRFEKGLTEEILKDWYNGGIKIIEWGLESASPSLLKVMTKGISINKVQEILESSKKVGILNKLLMFHNYPDETPEDLKMSIDFLEKNTKNQIVRPFFTIRNKLELRHNSELEVQSRDKGQVLFPKVWKMSSDFQSVVEYANKPDYHVKINEIEDFLDRIKDVIESRNVFSINDEMLTLDFVILDLQEQGHKTAINCI